MLKDHVIIHLNCRERCKDISLNDYHRCVLIHNLSSYENKAKNSGAMHCTSIADVIGLHVNPIQV